MGMRHSLTIIKFLETFNSVQSLSRVWFCDFMNRSMPGHPVLHQLPEYIQTHVHRIDMPTSHLILYLSPSPPAPNPSQHRVFSNESFLRTWWPKVLEFQLHHQSLPMNTQHWSPLEWIGCSSLQSKGPSRIFSDTTVQKHKLLLFSFLHSSNLTY